ncbi:MAG: hypothetical protein NT121_04765 [Chloroflexi bacterium]|nr:hypothetical protein [Chloroflexota bacterium]
MMNFTLRDLFGSGLALSLFPFVFIAPGYVVGWVFDFWIFRCRLPLVRLAMALILSVAVSPVLGFLLYRLGSGAIALSFFGLLGLIFVLILFRTRPRFFAFQPEIARYVHAALWIGLGWGILALFSLVDLQLGSRLYETVSAQDTTTRASIIDAISRTGVPPTNPGYYPGQPVPLTFLYYFWYVLASLVDQAGGVLVTARQAMIASVIWCGFALMALIAVYTRLRSNRSAPQIWKLALTGIGLLAVSGLDFLPASFIMYISRSATGTVWLGGDIEHWNEQITAWLGCLFWVPHHTAAFIACVTALLLLEGVRMTSLRTRLAGLVLAGFGFASALGLSVWVTLVFAVLWGVLMLAQLIQKNYRMAFWMVGSGLVAGLAISPFLWDLFHGMAGGGSGGFPLKIEIRQFIVTLFLENTIPSNAIPWLNLLFLPFNYFMELGFFLAAGWIWWLMLGRNSWKENRFYQLEIFILLTTVPIVTFLRSTVIGNNDFGWRGWLFGQFILLLWGAEVLFSLQQKDMLSPKRVWGFEIDLRTAKRILIPLLMLGVMTTVFDFILLRFWPILVDQNVTAFPVEISPDAHLGERTFAARLAYEYIQENIPANWVVQYNPMRTLDRPAGLYGSHQMALADFTSYGVSPDSFQKRRQEIGALFDTETTFTWQAVDTACKRYFIDVLIINDTDGVWKNLPALKIQRPSLYQNDYYEVFRCNP